MPDALLLLDFNVQIANHDNTTLGTDVLFGAAELPRGHVSLHDVDAILLVEGNAGHLIEAHHVVLTDEATLATCIVNKHLGDCCLASRYQMGVGRNLLEQMALTRPPRPEF